MQSRLHADTHRVTEYWTVCSLQGFVCECSCLTRVGAHAAVLCFLLCVHTVVHSCAYSFLCVIAHVRALSLLRLYRRALLCACVPIRMKSRRVLSCGGMRVWAGVLAVRTCLRAYAFARVHTNVYTRLRMCLCVREQTHTSGRNHSPT